MNILKYFKNSSILAAGLAIANTGLGDPKDNDLVPGTKMEPYIWSLRAIEIVSRDSKPAEFSKILYTGSCFKDCKLRDKEGGDPLKDPLIYFTTTDGEKISPDEVVTPWSLIECIGNDAYWGEKEKRPVIWVKGDPLSALTRTFIVLDSNGEFHYVGDLSTAENELGNVSRPLYECELEKETEELYKEGIKTAKIKRKIMAVKLRSTIPSGKHSFLTDGLINSVLYDKSNEEFSAVIDDDIKEFMQLSSDVSFDTNKRIGDVFFTYLHFMVISRAVKCFKFAISTGLYSLDNVARYAFVGGNPEIIRKLEDLGVSFDNVFVNAPLFSCCLFEHKVEHYKEDNILEVCEEFLREGMWPYVSYFIKTGNVKPEELFEEACKYGSCFLVKQLIEECNYKPEAEKANAALLRASEFGRSSIVKYLVEECDCDPETKDNNSGRTPLHEASWSGHLDMVKYLVEECRCNTEAKNNKGETALDLAHKRGHSDIVNYLNARNAGE